jgi:LPS-assembly protein
MAGGRLQLAIIVGLGLLAAPGTVATAQNTNRTIGSAPILFTADEVQYDQDLALTIAKGNVEVTQKDETLLADTVTYNQRTDTVTASGHVSLLEPNGDITFADFMELHDDLHDGFIKDIRILMSDRSRMAGNTARRSEQRTEVRRGVYSPCELCADDPSKPPLWQLRADRIVDDKETQTIEYHDAVMEFDGIPVFYTPYLSHPDPSVKRASGFLPLSVGTGSGLGYHVTVPYFWAIDTDKDFTFRPLFTTDAGVVLDGEYRQSWGFGKLDVDASVNYGSTAQTVLTPVDPVTGVAGTAVTTNSKDLRGHIFANGIFVLTDDIRTGFDVQRSTDQTYLLRFHFPSPSDFLTSHAFVEDFGERSYGNLGAYAFQSLSTTAGDGLQPIVLPTASYNWVSNPDSIGGRLALAGNVLNLERHSGPEIRRTSAGAEWRLPFNGPLGDRYEVLFSTRADGYSSDNVLLNPGDTTPHDETTGRVFPQGALLWRYPWDRHDPGTNTVIEPMAAFVAAPNGGNPARIPNEDSQGYEFDETSLFRPNRLPGYDRVDSGQRADYGLHAGFVNESSGSTNILVGQSYRFEHQSAFQIGSGLEDQLSDLVGRITVAPSDLLNIFYRLRLDHSDLAMRRQEAGFQVGPDNIHFGASYIRVGSIPGLVQLQTGDQIGVSLTAALTRYWSVALNDTRNISSGGATINSGVALTYRDDCFSMTTSVTQSGISIGDVTPGVTVLLTFVFKNLGELDLHALSVGGTQ